MRIRYSAIALATIYGVGLAGIWSPSLASNGFTSEIRAQYQKNMRDIYQLPKSVSYRVQCEANVLELDDVLKKLDRSAPAEAVWTGNSGVLLTYVGYGPFEGRLSISEPTLQVRLQPKLQQRHGNRDSIRAFYDEFDKTVSEIRPTIVEAVVDVIDVLVDDQGVRRFESITANDNGFVSSSEYKTSNVLVSELRDNELYSRQHLAPSGSRSLSVTYRQTSMNAKKIPAKITKTLSKSATLSSADYGIWYQPLGTEIFPRVIEGKFKKISADGTTTQFRRTVNISNCSIAFSSPSQKLLPTAQFSPSIPSLKTLTVQTETVPADLGIPEIPTVDTSADQPAPTSLVSTTPAESVSSVPLCTEKRTRKSYVGLSGIIFLYPDRVKCRPGR